MIKTSMPSMTQFIKKNTKKQEKKSIAKRKSRKNTFVSKEVRAIKSSNLKALSYAAIVEKEIKSQQAFTSYSQLIKKTKLNRFKTRFDLFL